MSELANETAKEICQWHYREYGCEGMQWFSPEKFANVSGRGSIPFIESGPVSPPRHDEDPIQALSVIDAMRRRGFDAPIKLEPKEDGTWFADFYWHCGRAETFSLAICEVGLAAWRAWSEFKGRKRE